jgi:hypothetical protein
MLFDSDVSCNFIDQEKEIFPIVLAKSGVDFQKWFTDNKFLIEQYILKYGGILFRNFGFNSVSEFNKIVQILTPNLLDYQYRSTPRTRLGGKIFTATEYPADKKIPLHNENSYTNSWPEKIFFFSVLTASEGGQTPVADSRKIYSLINSSIRDKFEQRGVLYVRNFTPGIDLSWQDVFQTDDPAQVGFFCQQNKIECSWQHNQDTVLTTRQVCQASLKHPKTGEYVWFNQAHLFHISALDSENVSYLVNEVGAKNLPRNAYYGDGAEIEKDVLEHIRDCYEKEKISFLWQKGDLMMLDNVLFAHGRETYKGTRKVVVAMA